jgi:hypothetical protein
VRSDIADTKAIEMYVITPGDVLTVFGLGVLLVLAAVALVVWVMRADRRCSECADTVELPRVPMRARRRPPRTGVVHGSRRPVPDDPTVVMPAMDGDR